MRPREIIKNIEKTIDLVQIDIEEAKSKTNFQAYDTNMKVLDLLKTAKNYIFLTIDEKLPAQQNSKV